MWKSAYRDGICFVLGTAGFLHELFISHAERPFVLTASLALMGFPFVLGVESGLRRRKE